MPVGEIFCRDGGSHEAVKILQQVFLTRLPDRVVGVKPSYDLVSRQGVVPLAWSLDHVGPLARYVGDAALLLDAMVAPRGVSFGGGIGQSLHGMRIGVVNHFHKEDMVADRATNEAIDRVARGLGDCGAQLSMVRLPALGLFNAVNRVLLQAEGYGVHGAELAAHPEMFSALTRKALLPHGMLYCQGLSRASASSYRVMSLSAASVRAISSSPPSRQVLRKASISKVKRS